MGQKIHRGKKKKEKETDKTEKKKKRMNQSIGREALLWTKRKGKLHWLTEFTETNKATTDNRVEAKH